MTANTRVVIMDDHALFRAALRRLLDPESTLHIVGEFSNALDLVNAIDDVRPEIVLMDIGVPGLAPLEAARRMRRRPNPPKVVFLTMYDDEEYVAEALTAGASGYVLKDSSATQLIEALLTISQGGAFFSNRPLSQIIASLTSSSCPALRRGDTLTGRELETIKYLAEGLSVKQIASTLNVSVKTVDAHKTNLMRKLDIHNKAQLVTYAVQKRILTLN